MYGYFVLLVYQHRFWCAAKVATLLVQFFHTFLSHIAIFSNLFSFCGHIKVRVIEYLDFLDSLWNIILNVEWFWTDYYLIFVSRCFAHICIWCLDIHVLRVMVNLSTVYNGWLDMNNLKWYFSYHLLFTHFESVKRGCVLMWC